MKFHTSNLTSDTPKSCAFCGRPFNPVSFDHYAPKHVYPAAALDFRVENLVYSCAECNRSAPREVQFTVYLSALLKGHPDFHDVEIEVLLDSDVRYRADIVAFKGKKRAQKKLIIECKGFAEFTPSRVRTTLDQLERYHALAGDSQLILAFPGMMDEKSEIAFKEADVEVWDALRIFDMFESQIAEAADQIFQKVFLEIRDRVTFEQRLIKRLKNCPAGPDHWIDYQDLIGLILKHLFCPPLTDPLVEHSDANKINRRDFIFPNYTDEKFWRFLRERYSADYIVVDAKNHAKRIKKEHVSQLSNYLKGAGVGKFGMIACRFGPDRGAATTAREQWLLYEKLVIFITNHDLERMLLAKAAQGDPTQIISDIIQDFRLSI
ncbi:HNH endonuclease [Rhizobium mongolense]|uniref:HNH endonuclease n=1 Tax=Rhizobium mongolense TaxID=57676 RepID=A0A7W6RSS5_9HYPH|nr:hypothetical protein [Rhizobium mongolense]MBB4277757.1 hypothetical protein [Rhizobium mongolense]